MTYKDNFRFGKIGKMVFSTMAIGLASFQIWQAIFGIGEAYRTRSIYLTTVLILVFISYPLSKKYKTLSFVIDLILISLILVAGGYCIIHGSDLIVKGVSTSFMDVAVGTIIVFLTLEATRRTVGFPLVAVTTFLIFLVIFGRSLPGMLMHSGWSFKEFVEYSYMSTEGIFGLPLGTAITTIFGFMILAKFLTVIKLSEYFGELSNSLAGHYKGGPAKVTVLAAALMGMISGSAAANVASTGSVTIPEMIRTGYSKAVSSAVSAVASTGGQIMPPIMAAAGFLIAAMIGVPYIQVAIAASLPAFLYFLSVGIAIHILAIKNNLIGVPKSKLPKTTLLLKNKWFLMLPLIVVIALMVKGYSPMASSSWALLVTIVLGILQRDNRINFWVVISTLEESTKSVLELFVTTACAGIIVTTLLMSGLSMKIPSLIQSIAGDNLFFTLILAAISLLILGCGMTTTAVYLIGATMLAPPIIQLGVPPMGAHLFILYFGIIGNVTPPVALAAYAAASISGANLWETSILAFKLAIAGFIIPFAFVSKPGLLLHGSTIEILWATFTMIIGALALTIAVQGFSWRKINLIERLILFGSTIALAYQSKYSDYIGLLVIAIVLLWNILVFKNKENIKS